MSETHVNADALTQGHRVRFGPHEYRMTGGAETLTPASTFVDLRCCDGSNAEHAVRTVESLLSDPDGEFVVFRRAGVGRDSSRRDHCVAVARAH